ncbi:MAG: SRPBCC family protein [Nakamurella sp.]
MTPTIRLSVAARDEHEIVMTRKFAAPRELVFAALTRPELLRRWYGPHGYQLVVCEVDLRVGGQWRYVVRAPDASEMVLRGTYREIEPPTRLVQTEVNEDCWAAAGVDATITTELTDVEDGTLLTATNWYPSAAVRDDVLRSGMERGVGQAYEKLETAISFDAQISDRQEVLS